MPLTLHFPTPNKAIFVTIGVTIALFYAAAVGQRAMHTVQLKQQSAGLDADIRALETRRNSLAEEKNRLTDGTDIETIARRELNMIKPGESAVVVIPSRAAVERSRQAQQPQPAANVPFWEQLWKSMFGG